MNSTAHRVHSLRTRLLLPLVVVSIAASIVVSVWSYRYATNRSEQELAGRFESIRETIQRSSFPLNRPVLQSIATLTDSQLVTMSPNQSVWQSVWQSTLATADEGFAIQLKSLGAPSGHVAEPALNVDHDGARYRVLWFERGSTPDSTTQVFVLFNEASVRDAKLRAIAAPLLTGLSTIFLLSTITLLLTSRLVTRLTRLQRQVEQIAVGDFSSDLQSDSQDEVGLLAQSVDTMAGQLQKMWSELQVRERERLLHLLASGLAHSLRNHMTGARMAIELHQRSCTTTDKSELAIAIHEIENTEAFVRRILLIASGDQAMAHPALVKDCLADVQRSLLTTAKHRNISIRWHDADIDPGAKVKDGAMLVMAISNLLFNAMHVAQNIHVVCGSRGNQIKIDVIDDGPGPSHDVQAQIFEPFVTNKPAGVGLGLPMVRQAARHLGGEVTWNRANERTSFTLSVKAV